MGVNSLPKTVTRQRRGCDLNPGPTAPESSTLTSTIFMAVNSTVARGFNSPDPLPRQFTLWLTYHVLLPSNASHQCRLYSKEAQLYTEL